MAPPALVVAALLLGALALDAAPAAASHVAYDESLRGIVAMPVVVPAPPGPLVRVEIRRPDGQPASGLRVRAEVFHGFARRVTVPLAPEGPGTYAARVPVEGAAGLWQGVLRVEGGPRPLIADIAFTVHPGAGTDGAPAPRPLGFRKAGPLTPRPWLDHLVWSGLVATIVLGAVGLARRPLPAPRPSPALPLSAWMVVLGIAGALAGPLGAHWDVAWHVDRGRETFWSPPHLLIYSGIVAVLVSVLAALALAPGGPRRALAHRGLRFALAAGAATLASAPFDEAWHALFGLDVSIWSPPHLLLLFGSAASMLGLALLHAERLPRLVARLAVVMLAAAALLIVGLFVLEFEFVALERWHVVLARPRGLYALCATVLGLLVLGSAARLGGPGTATAAALVAWLIRVGVALVFLPALGRTAPLLPPLALVPALALDLVLLLAPRAWPFGRRFTAGGVVATVAAYAVHNPVAGLLGGRAVPPADLWAWFPVALVAGASAAFLGLRIGALARPVAADPA